MIEADRMNSGPHSSLGRQLQKDVSERVPEHGGGASKIQVVSVPGGIVITLLSVWFPESTAWVHISDLQKVDVHIPKAICKLK